MFRLRQNLQAAAHRAEHHEKCAAVLISMEVKVDGITVTVRDRITGQGDARFFDWLSIERGTSNPLLPVLDDLVAVVGGPSKPPSAT